MFSLQCGILATSCNQHVPQQLQHHPDTWKVSTSCLTSTRYMLFLCQISVHAIWYKTADEYLVTASQGTVSICRQTTPKAADWRCPTTTRQNFSLRSNLTHQPLQKITAIVEAVACQVAKASLEGTCQAGVGSPGASRSLVGEACQGVGALVAHNREGVLACRVETHTLVEVDTGHLKQIHNVPFQYLVLKDSGH